VEEYALRSQKKKGQDGQAQKEKEASQRQTQEKGKIIY
jgi:hypothetical protein